MQDYVESLRQQCQLHRRPLQEILAAKERNWANLLGSMTSQEKLFWFGDKLVNTLDDLMSLESITAADIKKHQSQSKWHPWPKAPMLFGSSGSSTGVRLLVPRTLAQWHQFMVSVGRQLESHGVNQDDTIMSTDQGHLFTGGAVIEDAANLLFDVSRVRNGVSTVQQKLEMMGELGVNIVVGTPHRLVQLARATPAQYLSRPIKMVISTGADVSDCRHELEDAFGVGMICDTYGAAELSNMGWTCPDGHMHFNIDHVHVDQGKYYTNLTTQKLFKYEIPGESVHFSHKGTCTCGSNLPTVDSLVFTPADRTKKG